MVCVVQVKNRKTVDKYMAIKYLYPSHLIIPLFIAIFSPLFNDIYKTLLHFSGDLHSVYASRGVARGCCYNNQATCGHTRRFAYSRLLRMEAKYNKESCDR